MVKAKAVFVAFLTQKQAKKVRLSYIKFGFVKVKEGRPDCSS